MTTEIFATLIPIFIAIIGVTVFCGLKFNQIDKSLKQLDGSMYKILQKLDELTQKNKE